MITLPELTLPSGLALSHTDRQSQTDSEIEREWKKRDRETDRDTVKQWNGQTNTQWNRQTDAQWDRQIHSEADTETESQSEKERKKAMKLGYSEDRIHTQTE